LIVDDEETIRTVTSKTLERFNYRCVLAANGAEAIAVYARRGSEIALVLTDMAMPIMDGPATIVALRSMNPCVKIIGCSGHASANGVAKALGAGVLHFIPKPYTAGTLINLLHASLSPSSPRIHFRQSAMARTCRCCFFRNGFLSVCWAPSISGNSGKLVQSSSVSRLTRSCKAGHFQNSRTIFLVNSQNVVAILPSGGRDARSCESAELLGVPGCPITPHSVRTLHARLSETTTPTRQTA